MEEELTLKERSDLSRKTKNPCCIFGGTRLNGLPDMCLGDIALVITRVLDHCPLCFPHLDAFQAENHSCSE